MSIEEDDILIHNFLRNNLSEKERKEIMLKMEEDETFREKVNFEEQLLLNFNTSEWSISKNSDHPQVREYEDLFRDKSANKLKETLRKTNAKYQETQKPKTKSWLLYSGIAAITVLIGITLFSPSKTSTQELYTSYLSTSDLPSLVDRGNTSQQQLIRAQKLFEAKKYDQTLTILTNDLPEPQKNKAAIYLYTGISQMELGKYHEAEKTFDRLIESPLIDAPKGRWYKALLYIKNKESKKAKGMLLEITKSSTNYKFKEATELLEKL